MNEIVTCAPTRLSVASLIDALEKWSLDEVVADLERRLNFVAERGQAPFRLLSMPADFASFMMRECER